MTDLPPITLLLQEIQSLTSSMRRNQRWAPSSSQFQTSQPPLPPYLQTSRKRRPSPRKSRVSVDGDEGDLMVGFIHLRRALMEIKDIKTISPLELTGPFLALIRSPLTSGPITSLALTSLNTIILNLLPEFLSQPKAGPSTPLQICLAHITSALSSCRFPSSSPQQDELVLLRLLRVIESLAMPIAMSNSSGIGCMLDQMGDESVCELLEVGLGMLARARLGEGLRGTAQSCVQMVVRAVFIRLRGLTPSDVEQLLQASKEGDKDDIPRFTPYGLPTVLELLRVLIALLDPADQTHTDSMRLAALSVLNTAMEVGGSSLGQWSELREGVKDEGCRYLFQLTRSDASILLGQSLRTTSTLFSTMLPHLKLQLELFLSYLIDRLTPQNPPPIPSRPGTPSVATFDDTPSTPKPISLLPPVPTETRELMLETLAQIAQKPSFMVDCWINYDCSADSEDIFERLIVFLTRGVYPVVQKDGEGLDGAQLLSLEILLGFVSAMAERQEGDEKWTLDTSPETVSDGKKNKAILLAGAAAFNAKPKNGIKFLQDQGFIIPDDLPGTEQEKRDRSIAKFLRSSSRLDKKLLGEYISRPDQIGLLKAFMASFDFKGKTIADAMRELLETFRLPGESQPISRITEVFAEQLFSTSPPEIATQDAAYVLAYSVIMLNTDQHNPQNRKRMTIDDYKRNLRGVNDGKDFDPEYLASIHESIKKKEIILPEEHVGQPGFDYAWKSLMARARTSGPMISCNTAVFDEAMFKLSWRSVVSAIAYAFTMSAQDEHMIQRAITGFRQCASLAGQFKLPEVFDMIVQSLSSATGLLDEGYHMSPHPIVEKDNQNLTVSPLAIRFGQSYRSQLATVVLFTIANGNGSAIRDGWSQIFEMLQTLFLHSLLPLPMMQMEDFLAGQTTIPMKPAPAPVDRRAEGGLLSALSSYLLSPYGQIEEPLMEINEEDVENTLVAVDCLNSCKLEEIYGEILSLELDALLPALKAIRSLAEARSNITEVSETGSPRQIQGQLPYDPACVFHLEMMVSLASRGKEHIGETWPIIFVYISTLLGSAQSYSILLIERAVVGLLRLSLLISSVQGMRDQLYLSLDVLRSLPPTVFNAVAEQLTVGIARILEREGVVQSQTEWGLFVVLFKGTVDQPEAGKITLEVLGRMIKGDKVKEEYRQGVLGLLDDFAGTRKTTPGLQALDLLYELRSIPLAPLLILSKHCLNPSKDLRSRSMSHLQRILLSPNIITDPALFDQVLFPLMDSLAMAKGDLGEMRNKAATTMCKVFLQYVVRAEQGGMFQGVLERMERFMRGERDMNEAGESLKNVILVMHSSNMLVPPPAEAEDARTEEQKKLWQDSAERIERILPGFLKEIGKN